MTDRDPRGPDAIPEAAEWARFGEARFISLATYRRSGARVATTVWAAPDGDALIVTTPSTSGKVKRLRNSSRAQVSVSGRMGRVPEDAPVVDAICEILGSEHERPVEVARLQRKYGLEYRIIVAVERWQKRRRRRTDERLILRITRAPHAR